jgi:hypothetical protein
MMMTLIEPSLSGSEGNQYHGLSCIMRLIIEDKKVAMQPIGDKKYR